jgi:hypothetical protein
MITPFTEGDDKRLGRIRDRIDDQAQNHWLGFASIVASTNIVLAIAVTGRILLVQGLIPDDARPTAIFMLATSFLAVLVAYYSIRVGSLLIFGLASLSHIVLSFIIAGTQASLFLWISSAAEAWHNQHTSDTEIFELLRHWFLILALFAGAAAVVNWRARSQRINVPLPLKEYERRQTIDRWSAAATCCFLLLWYSLTFRFVDKAFLLAGVSLAFLTLARALHSQWQQSQTIRKAIDAYTKF